MLPRLIVLLLTLAVPAQGMAVRHSHETSDQEPSGDRGRMPHFHVGTLHRHAMGEQHHACHHRSDSLKPVGTAAATAPEGCDSPEGDAVYVSSVDSVAQAKVKLPSPQTSANELTFHALPAISPRTVFRFQDQPPSDNGPPIFLKMVSLQI